MTSSIETAKRDELPRILELLEEAGLPVAGVDHAESFLVREQERLIGCIGLETYGAPSDSCALSPFARIREEAVWGSCSSSGYSKRRAREA